MATFFYRQKHSRRRLAALNFLSNISLDGSVEDSKFAPSSKLTLQSDSLENEGNTKKVSKKSSQASLSFNDHQKTELLCTVMVQGNVCNNQTTNADVKHSASVMKEEKTQMDENALIKMENSAVSIRDRSPTGNSMFKAQKGATSSNANICHASSIPGTTSLVPHSEKASVDFFEFPTASYLFPNSTRSRKISSNTSESSYSPTGSGAKEKEVRFLTSAYDWSNQMTDQRLVLVTCNCSPVVLFSTLPFSRISKLSRGEFRSDSGRRRHPSSSTRPVSSTDYPDLYHLLGLAKPGDGQVVSYCQMLVPSGNAGRELITPRRLHISEVNHYENDRASKVSTIFRSHDRPHHIRPSSPLQIVENMKIDNEELGPQTFSNLGHFGYHPSLLDDPELIAGKHSTRIALLTFSSYMTSVIDYVKPSDLKKELNDKFREKFPHIHLTLSKIRSLKREMRKVAKQDSGTGTDLLTVAQSYVFFEKLILRGLVHKGNRKLCAGATLLLSAKMNDVKGDSLKTLIEEIQNNFRISRRELFASEFAVLVALEFSLHSPTWEIFSHYQRLLYDS
ncbi:CDK5 and ABL1 enzyme substrate 2-like isoform X1 [Daphnia carinata]|uniref:CDK5 and ABL1 enzyme substrate 2-like isoform X2 n=1 Tax=Daphnia carinata TaxID=120202 RepID=UPI00257D62FE|nr:CDK5 and ABL1 enzyme substrate 2-like isoform X2 [Daphnia carinata]XP_059351823.1 CDK5 and ABL1 enzyme substrate 2-like isoform X1 [Daphnia carinata]